jgi:hypothetical protein
MKTQKMVRTTHIFQHNRARVVAARLVVGLVRAIAERERARLEAAAQRNNALRRHRVLQILDVHHVHDLRRVVRRHRRSHAIIVRARPRDLLRLLVLRGLGCEVQTALVRRQPRLDDQRASVVAGLRNVRGVRAITVRERRALVAAAERGGAIGGDLGGKGLDVSGPHTKTHPAPVSERSWQKRALQRGCG